LIVKILTGKTLSTISLCWTMCRQSITGSPAASKIVIVTPSGLVGNWTSEFKRWLTHQRLKPLVVNVVGKDAQQVVDDFVISSSAVAPVLIISYEMYRKYGDKLLGAKIGLLVCDEGHRLKNSDGNKTIAALAACPAKRRVLLSGTPVQNDLTVRDTLAVLAKRFPYSRGSTPLRNSTRW
jgi:DNA repair and recombination protein RAD54 and RAD54-like protein